MRDFHTHNVDVPWRALISCSAKIPGKLCSLECHPWYLGGEVVPLSGEFKAALPAFDALGEAGLDRLRGPEMSVQLAMLRQLFVLARECGKPVVCHVVRAHEEFFALRKEFPELKVMLHGFRGSRELLSRLWRNEVTVSLHTSAVNNQGVLEMLRVPFGKFGFESDDCRMIDLPEVLERTALLAGNKDIEKLSDEAFEEFVNG